MATLLGEQASLGVREPKAPRPKASTQHAVLGKQILDRVALSRPNQLLTKRMRNWSGKADTAEQLPRAARLRERATARERRRER